VADSELTPSEAERPAHDLWENRVAIAVFAVVLNRSVANVTSLTRARIAQIYAGSITNWGQVGGPDLEITVVGRTADSGTHYVFSRSFVAYVARNVRSDTTFIDIRDAGDAMASHE
jgi:ABC-type phosphate transport system substrate-binding protein